MGTESVVIPLAWFLGVIASLGGIIGILAKTIYGLLKEQIERGRLDTTNALNALNSNTEALNRISSALEKEAK